MILCERDDGQVRAYVAGKLSANDLRYYNMIGYKLWNANIEEPWSRYKQKTLDRFTELDVWLTTHTDSIEMTTNQLSFSSRHQVDKKSPFKNLPSDFAFIDNNPCRY